MLRGCEIWDCYLVSMSRVGGTGTGRNGCILGEGTSGAGIERTGFGVMARARVRREMRVILVFWCLVEEKECRSEVYDTKRCRIE